MKQAKPEAFQQTYSLTGETIDIVAERVEEFLTSLGIDRANVFRIRISVEEALLRWKARFGEHAKVTLTLGTHLFRPAITISLPGDSLDPFAVGGNETGSWANTMLGSIGLTPRFSYENGVNTLQLRIRKPRNTNPAVTLVIAVALGILFGEMGKNWMPDSLVSQLIEAILNSFSEGFFRILNAASGPVIFFTLLASVCSTGRAVALSPGTNRMVVRILNRSLIFTAIGLVISVCFMTPEMIPMELGEDGIYRLTGMVLEIIPNDFFSPFVEGDSPQLILMALVLGNALLRSGKQTDGLVGIFEQANVVGLLIADWVSRLAPLFIIALLALQIASGSTAIYLGLVKPFLVFGVIILGILLEELLRISGRENVSPRELVRKMKDSFLIAFRTGSVDAAYGSNKHCCERRFGIRKTLTEYGLPMGLILYMPAGTLSAIVVTLYTACAFHIQVTPDWYVLALFLIMIMWTATPPVSGIGILTFTVLFDKLGIPSEALSAAIVADTLLGFIVIAADQALLQLYLIGEAARMDLLNRTLLRKPLSAGIPKKDKK